MTKRPTRARSVPRVDPRGPAARTRHDHAQELAQDFLTSAGQRLARESRERHDVVVRFLVDVPRRVVRAVAAEAERVRSLVGDTRFTIRFPNDLHRELSG